jgi:hypothetical protein
MRHLTPRLDQSDGARRTPAGQRGAAVRIADLFAEGSPSGHRRYAKPCARRRRRFHAAVRTMHDAEVVGRRPYRFISRGTTRAGSVEGSGSLSICAASIIRSPSRRPNSPGVELSWLATRLY